MRHGLLLETLEALCFQQILPVGPVSCRAGIGFALTVLEKPRAMTAVSVIGGFRS